MSRAKQPILYSATDKHGETRFAFHLFDDKSPKNKPVGFRIAWDAGFLTDVLSCSCRCSAFPPALRDPNGYARQASDLYTRPGRPAVFATGDDDVPDDVVPVHLSYDGDEVGDPQPNHSAMIRWLLAGERT